MKDKPFPEELGLMGMRPILPDEFPLEEGRRTVMGTPVLTMDEYAQIQSWFIGSGNCAAWYEPSGAVKTFRGIPIIHERDAAILERAVEIMASARERWTGRPRDWSREEAMFRAISGGNDD